MTEISQGELPPMPEKSVFMFHYNFYPKPRIDLEDAKITQEMRQKSQLLKQDYDDIVSKHRSNIRVTYLEEMTIETDPELPPVACKLYPLPLKHHKFVKEEIENLLEAGLIEISVSPYAAPIIVVSRKCTLGTPLAETKRLVINYRKLNKQIPRVQTTEAKSKGSLALIETTKIDHTWSKLKGEKYFTIL